MTFESAAVVALLRELKQQLLAFRRCSHAIATAPRHEATRMLAEADAIADLLEGSRRALQAIARSVVRLRRQVVPHDGLGEPLESVDELALRAARMVVLAALPRLREAPSTELAGGTTEIKTSWATMSHDVTAFFETELDRITRLWYLPRPGQLGRSQRDRVSYRASLGAALQAMRDLAEHSEVRAFLYRGLALPAPAAATHACAQIVAVLAIDIASCAPGPEAVDRVEDGGEGAARAREQPLTQDR